MLLEFEFLVGHNNIQYTLFCFFSAQWKGEKGEDTERGLRKEKMWKEEVKGDGLKGAWGWEESLTERKEGSEEMGGECKKEGRRAETEGGVERETKEDGEGEEEGEWET